MKKGGIGTARCWSTASRAYRKNMAGVPWSWGLCQISGSSPAEGLLGRLKKLHDKRNVCVAISRTFKTYVLLAKNLAELGYVLNVDFVCWVEEVTHTR